MPGHCLTLNKQHIFFITILLTTSAFCQLQNLKWQKADITYEQPDQIEHRVYSFESDNAGEFLKKSLINTYWFFISDVDGDNCAFRPSCSTFFVDAIGETNIFQAALMFSDRLTRDTNPVKWNNYPREKNGHYYDPSINYTLVQAKINYMPPTFVVDDE